MTQTITILQLYPRDMNIYGDWGNVLVLKRRLEWRGYDVKLIEYNVGDIFPTDDIDIIVGGGGQDSGQQRIQSDLQKIAPQLRALANDNVPILVVCGLYQLFGHRFITKDGEQIAGIGLLDITTIGDTERIVGNTTIQSPQFGQIVGYENHSGLTTLSPKVEPLGEVIRGIGNSPQQTTEGARYRNVIGTYLHGSLLPKNPRIADWMLQQAIERRYGPAKLQPLDDKYVELARTVAMQRPR